MAIVNTIKQLIKPSINSLGYDLWAIEYLQGKTKTLRVYIDKNEGVILDDCVVVSENINPILDVENPISVEYILEVSSPGLERKLFEIWHYEKFIGSKVKLKLFSAVNNKKIIIGKIIRTDDNIIIINDDKNNINIDFNLINKANLVIDF